MSQQVNIHCNPNDSWNRTDRRLFEDACHVECEFFWYRDIKDNHVAVIVTLPETQEFADFLQDLWDAHFDVRNFTSITYKSGS